MTALTESERMTAQPPPNDPSTLQSGTPSIPHITMDAAIAAVPTWDLPPLRQRDVITSLNRIVRMTGRPASAVPLIPGSAFRAVLPTWSAMHYGLDKSSISNIRSHLKDALPRLGVALGHHAPLSPAWSAALAPLDSRVRAGVVAFGRCCSSRRIPPELADLAAFQAFEAELTEDPLTAHPRRDAGKMLGQWNRLCRTNPAWPGRLIAKPKNAHDFILPIGAFTASFQAAIKEFGAHLVADPFEQFRELAKPADGGISGRRPTPRKQVRQSTRAGRESHVRILASAVVATGVPIAEITSLGDLMIPLERAAGALEWLWERAGQKASSPGHHAAAVLITIGRHHVRLPPEDLDQLRNMARSVTLKYTGITAKNDRNVRAVLDPARYAKFKAVPDSLMTAARKLRDKAVKSNLSQVAAARQALRAVAIQILMAIPMRVSNLCKLRFGNQLERDGAPGGRITYLTVHPDDTKTEAPYRVPVAPEIGRLIEEWIRDFRPALAAAACPYLFPGNGTGDSPMTRQGMAAAIKTTMAQLVGPALSPHQFRHLAARNFLQAFPGHYEELRLLLGHKLIETTLRLYGGLAAETAQRRYDELIFGKPKALKAAPPKAFRPTKPVRRRAGRS